MICSSLYLLVLMAIILRVDGLLGKMTGTVYGKQVTYPCLAFLTEDQSVIKTIAKGAQICYDTAVENAKRHCGKIINLMLDVQGGDYVGVEDSLIRPGYPARIDAYSYRVRQNPTMLDRELQGAV